MSQHPLSAARLHSLIGDAMNDLPADFIEKLERMLEDNGMPHPDTGRVVHLSMVRQAKAEQASPSPDASGFSAITAVFRRLEGASAALAILHASPPWLAEPKLMEGLLIASHELVIATVEALHACGNDGPCPSA